MKSIGNEGLFNLVEKLENNRAETKTTIRYAKNSKQIYFFEGSVKGIIISPKGKYSFSWDPVFQPNGYSKNFAELTQDEKNEISMRRIALNKLKEFMRAKN